MNLVWFRNDLRIMDNPALWHACNEANGQGVAAVAMLCAGQWATHDESKARVNFWLANLEVLSSELAALNIKLHILEVPYFTEVPDQLLKLAQTLNSRSLYFNEEYPLNERQRDRQVADLFSDHEIAVRSWHADVLLPPGEVLNGQGEAYRVFTPYSRTWRKQLMSRFPDLLPVPQRIKGPRVEKTVEKIRLDYPLTVGADWQQKLWPAGAEAAQQRLESFIDNGFKAYGERRDRPAIDATSSLSPYLSVGVLSVKQCLYQAQAAGCDSDWFNRQWITELIWREFYRHHMVQFPELCRWQPFRPETEARIQWQHSDHLFEAWCQAETGFPIVDAGMKQLLETGWMHNRVRMITASFLTKLLREDWRRGARFFMQHLVDADFASNLGGWQWSSSVGADAAPYFRIFNPQRQAERFDTEGEYVAHWLPELKALRGLARHDPEKAVDVGRPAPIIDYKLARAESLALYKGA